MMGERAALDGSHRAGDRRCRQSGPPFCRRPRRVRLPTGDRTGAGGALRFALLVATATVFAGIGTQAVASSAAGAPGRPPLRIVSLVPAVTEMLFAVGAGPQVVGVSTFDRYPPDVATRARVGALLDPDVERILALRPDLVVVYGSQQDLAATLDKAGIAQFRYRHGGLADVAATIRELGRVAGRAASAERVAAELLERIDRVRARVAGRPRPRVLVVIAREALELRQVYASGGVGFIADMLAAAGGANVFADVAREAVQASTELILARAPEAIVELRASLDARLADRERGVWQRLPALPAVRSGRVAILVGEELVVPGPRIAAGVERIARALHPASF